ncbi:hypothetical protein MIMGU_mgv11b019389mg [Erythranthe guttata]|uniref:RING-type E3 ubiquitin transferase n=1 Tax=Erythranthe guttata TaxID=4155 RepID=A0A022R0A6_ERYGU|nr:hypothetical protein MIMGU_mgv11b019389mg [Erythranthe guttata]
MAIRNFFVFVFLFLSIVHAQNNCPPSYCNNNSQAIRFPFWLQGRQLPSNCQPIGFNLSCNDQSKAILNIPRAGDFYNEVAAVILPNCKKMVTVPIPVSYLYGYTFPVNLVLRWDDVPATPTGAESKETVSRNVSSSLLIGALIVPVVIIGTSCCICMMLCGNPRDSGSDQTSGTAGLSNTVTPGLSTIETYKKVTIGESRRVEGPNGVTCAICLADYVPKDTIMFLPECQHCFHAECIDRWLTIKAKCPICRTLQA